MQGVSSVLHEQKNAKLAKIKASVEASKAITKAEQKKASNDAKVAVAKIATAEKEAQFAKEATPILVTVEGIVIDGNL